MNPEAVHKINLIEKSLRCFTFGILSLVPVLGLPFAIGVLVMQPGIRRQSRLAVNHARRYVLLARILIIFGFLSSLIGGGMILGALLSER